MEATTKGRKKREEGGEKGAERGQIREKRGERVVEIREEG